MGNNHRGGTPASRRVVNIRPTRERLDRFLAGFQAQFQSE
jgi:hypothetical protein